MAKAKVIKLYDERVAACPECDGDIWYIHITGKTVNDITALECANPDCGYMAIRTDPD